MLHRHVPVCTLIMCMVAVCGLQAQFDAGMRMGAAIGSPVPIGHIPAGATGSAVPGFVGGIWIRDSLSASFRIGVDVVYTHYASTFASPLVDQPFIDNVVVTGDDGSQTVLEVETVLNGQSSGKFENSYLQIPFLAMWSAASDLYIIGGPYLGYLISTGTYATGVGTVGIRPEIVQKDMSFTEKIRRWDVGLQAGAQWFVLRDLFLDGRVTYGLNSIFDPSYKTIQYPVQNLFVSFSVGVVLL